MCMMNLHVCRHCDHVGLIEHALGAIAGFTAREFMKFSVSHEIGIPFTMWCGDAATLRLTGSEFNETIGRGM